MQPDAGKQKIKDAQEMDTKSGLEGLLVARLVVSKIAAPGGMFKA